MKQILRHLAPAMVATVVWAALPAWSQNATTTTSVTAESTVQYTASGATGSTNYLTGYDKVKYSATTPAKSYLKFDFTGQNPNTNYALKFSLPYAANNGKTHVLVWVLNQGYAGFTSGAPYPTAANPSLTWSGAQANDTGIGETDFNRMLTNGTFSATLVNDFIGSGTSGSAGTSIPAPWGQYLFNNQVVIVLTATNDPSAVNANGGRFAVNAATAEFQPLTAGTAPPTISAIADQTVMSTTPSSDIAFTVSDPLDAASTLTNFTISLGNANVSLTATNIEVGPGGNRTLTFTPVSNLAPGVTASVTITLTLTDSSGNSASSSFLLTVPPAVSLPVLYSGTTNVNSFNPTNLLLSAGSVTIPFQVVDTNITSAQLLLAGEGSAYTTNLGAISFTKTDAGGNTNNCTVTVPVTGSGVGIVNIHAIDPVNLVTNTVRLAVMVLPDDSYAAFDLMNYQPSTTYSGSAKTKLYNASAELWATRGSGNGSVDLITSITPSPYGGMPVGVPLIRGSSSGNQVQMRLAGAPYTPGSHKVIFASINAQWCDVSLYGGSAYYPANSAGGFVEFAADANSTGVAMAAVCTVTHSGDFTANSGQFALGLNDGANDPVTFTGHQESIPDYTVNSPLPNPADNIVISYDVDTGISSLWVNQADSTQPNVNLQEVAPANLVNCSYLVLRQNAGMGQILIERAAVKVVAKVGVPATPVITGITYNGGTVVISFTGTAGSGGTAIVVGSPTVDGNFSPASPAAVIAEPTPGNFTATFAATGDQNFYKIEQTGSGTTPTVTFPF